MKKILYIYVRGGAPLEYVFPRLAACGELHVLAFAPMPKAAEGTWRPCCATITMIGGTPHGEETVARIVTHAKAIGADAVLTLSEFAVVAVAQAALRLGLAGAGEGIWAARDKRVMREAWAAAGVPIPQFRRVASASDLRRACQELTPPLLLKPAWGAGSVAQLVLTHAQEATAAWGEIEAALKEGSKAGMNDLYVPDTDADRLVEEIVSGSTESWFGDDRYADYISVEGIVANGSYHPLAVTAKLPTVGGFTEVASTTPCELPLELQQRIVDVSRRAVDALGLDTCGTHTELKLMKDGQIAVIETAARFGGLMTLRRIETVFGLDAITMFTRQLLYEAVDYPTTVPFRGTGAAASLAVVPADASGVAWRTHPIWNPD
ncbi:ATP-grasp domain-containing protein, partial [Streptomyces sp. NPDC051133]|uniref:ATP-grasp domain-containing protein n=1 Tax=Streptomyces sp. NPDC051133 TaxID=3155521 RepID=UPI0034248BE1